MTSILGEAKSHNWKGCRLSQWTWSVYDQLTQYSCSSNRYCHHHVVLVGITFWFIWKHGQILLVGSFDVKVTTVGPFHYAIVMLIIKASSSLLMWGFRDTPSGSPSTTHEVLILMHKSFGPHCARLMLYSNCSLLMRLPWSFTPVIGYLWTDDSRRSLSFFS